MTGARPGPEDVLGHRHPVGRARVAAWETPAGRGRVSRAAATFRGRVTDGLSRGPSRGSDKTGSPRPSRKNHRDKIRPRGLVSGVLHTPSPRERLCALKNGRGETPRPRGTKTLLRPAIYTRTYRVVEVVRFVRTFFVLFFFYCAATIWTNRESRYDVDVDRGNPTGTSMESTRPEAVTWTRELDVRL